MLNCVVTHIPVTCPVNSLQDASLRGDDYVFVEIISQRTWQTDGQSRPYLLV